MVIKAKTPYSRAQGGGFDRGIESMFSLLLRLNPKIESKDFLRCFGQLEVFVLSEEPSLPLLETLFFGDWKVTLRTRVLEKVFGAGKVFISSFAIVGSCRSVTSFDSMLQYVSSCTADFLGGKGGGISRVNT
uniref:Uncharacterized protein n=1 Tax=Glossina pallidipes TaxID=7398 RepID=A0A1A9Z5W0_GLOPL